MVMNKQEFKAQPKYKGLTAEQKERRWLDYYNNNVVNQASKSSVRGEGPSITGGPKNNPKDNPEELAVNDVIKQKLEEEVHTCESILGIVDGASELTAGPVGHIGNFTRVNHSQKLVVNTAKHGTGSPPYGLGIRIAADLTRSYSIVPPTHDANVSSTNKFDFDSVPMSPVADVDQLMEKWGKISYGGTKVTITPISQATEVAGTICSGNINSGTTAPNVQQDLTWQSLSNQRYSKIGSAKTKYSDFMLPFATVAFQPRDVEMNVNGVKPYGVQQSSKVDESSTQIFSFLATDNVILQSSFNNFMDSVQPIGWGDLYIIIDEAGDIPTAFTIDIDRHFYMLEKFQTGKIKGIKDNEEFGSNSATGGKVVKTAATMYDASMNGKFGKARGKVQRAAEKGKKAVDTGLNLGTALLDMAELGAALLL